MRLLTAWGRLQDGLSRKREPPAAADAPPLADAASRLPTPDEEEAAGLGAADDEEQDGCSPAASSGAEAPAPAPAHPASFMANKRGTLRRLAPAPFIRGIQQYYEFNGRCAPYKDIDLGNGKTLRAVLVGAGAQASVIAGSGEEALGPCTAREVVFKPLLDAEQAALEWENLERPAMPRAYGVVRLGGVDYLVMERMHSDLQAFLGSRARPGSRGSGVDVLCALGSATTAVQRLSDAGIVNRDIKPANLLVDVCGRGGIVAGSGLGVVVGDLGFAVLLSPDPSAPGGMSGKSSDLIGNAFALPPEAFLDEGVISKAYDFLGTGSVALWTLAGREYLELRVPNYIQGDQCLEVVEAALRHWADPEAFPLLPLPERAVEDLLLPPQVVVPLLLAAGLLMARDPWARLQPLTLTELCEHAFFCADAQQQLLQSVSSLSFRSLDSLTTFINHSSELAMWHVVAKEARHLLRPGIDTLLQHRVRLLSAELAALAACLADVPRPPAYGSSGRWGFSDKPLYYDAVERSGTAVHGALLACDDGSVVPNPAATALPWWPAHSGTVLQNRTQEVVSLWEAPLVRLEQRPEYLAFDGHANLQHAMSFSIDGPACQLLARALRCVDIDKVQAPHEWVAAVKQMMMSERKWGKLWTDKGGRDLAGVVVHVLCHVFTILNPLQPLEDDLVRGLVDSTHDVVALVQRAEPRVAAAVLRLLFHPDFDLLARCQRGKVAAQAEAKLPLLLALTCLHGFHQQAELVRWQLGTLDGEVAAAMHGVAAHFLVDRPISCERVLVAVSAALGVGHLLLQPEQLTSGRFGGQDVAVCPLCDLPEMQGAWAALQALLAGPPGHPLSGSTVLLRWPRLPASMAALLMLACGKGAVKRCCTRTLLSHLPPKAAKKLVKAAVPAAHLAEAAAVMAAAGAGGSAQAALVQLLRLVLEPQQ